MGVPENIKELKNAVINLKSLVNELVLRNKQLERENLRLRQLTEKAADPEEISAFKSQIEFYRNREIKVRKKLNRLIVKLEKLELLDAEETAEKEEEVIDG